jgi:hypothetical protein
VSEELDNCVSCGALVPYQGEPPYEGHKRHCRLVLGWKHTDKCQKLLSEISEIKEREEAIMNGDVACKKCGTDLGYGWDAMRHERTLIGGYKAVLCVDCINLLGEFLKTKPEWDESRKQIAEEKSVGSCFEAAGADMLPEARSAYDSLTLKADDLHNRLYDITKAWVADKVSAPTPTP